jgi:hypothetical protein
MRWRRGLSGTFATTLALGFAGICVAGDLTVHILGGDVTPAPDVRMNVMYRDKAGFEYVAIQSPSLKETPAGTIRFAVPRDEALITLRISSAGHTRYYSEPIPTRESGDMEKTIRLSPARMVEGRIPQVAGGEVVLLTRFDPVAIQRYYYCKTHCHFCSGCCNYKNSKGMPCQNLRFHKMIKCNKVYVDRIKHKLYTH